MCTRKYVPVKDKKKSQINKYPSIKRQIMGVIFIKWKVIIGCTLPEQHMRVSEDPLPSKTNFTGKNSLKIYI